VGAPNVPPSGGSLEIGNVEVRDSIDNVGLGSPFGGIPRNWKLVYCAGLSPPQHGQFPLRGDP